MAFELSEKTWKLGFTTGHSQKPREHNVPARNQERILDEIVQAKRHRSYWIPESFWPSSSMSAPSNTLPRFRTL